MPRHSAQPFLSVLVVATLLAACDGGSRVASAQAASPENVADLLPYDGPMRVLFDDNIDSEAFSRSGGSASVQDMRLIERIRTSAFVVPVVVVTITEQQQAAVGHVDLELMPVGHPFHGSLTPYFEPGEPIKLAISQEGAGYALARSNQSELIGKRLNLCWSRFAEGSTVRPHWHAFSDSPKTKLALLRAAAVVNVD